MGRWRVLRSAYIALAAVVLLLVGASAAQAAFVIDDRPLPPGNLGTH